MPDKTTTETKTEPTVSVDGRKVTWGYSKKISDYGTGVEVSIYMTDMVPEGTDITKFLSGETETAFDLLKAEVWGAHDLEYGFTEAGRPELVVQVPTPLQAQVVQAQAAAVLPIPMPQVPDEALAAPPAAAPLNTAPVAGTLVGVYPEIPTFCKDCGKTEFWDNRVQNDDKITKGKKIGPDFKCKNKECEGGSGNGSPIYREGSYDYNQAVGKAPAAPAAMQPPAAPPVQPPLTPANITAPEGAPDEAPF